MSKSSILSNEPFTTIINRSPVIVCSDEGSTTDSGSHSPSLLNPQIRRRLRSSRAARRTPYLRIAQVIQDEDVDIDLNSASYLDQYEQARPDTHLVCSYFVFKAHKLTIMIAARGVYEYTDEHGELAIKHLKRWRFEIVEAINATLDEAGFMLNRITHHGLTALLESRGPASPYGQAMEHLNNFTRLSYENPAIERVFG